jgi:hypothetical protein
MGGHLFANWIGGLLASKRAHGDGVNGKIDVSKIDNSSP